MLRPFFGPAVLLLAACGLGPREAPFQALEQRIERELADKGIPALSIALVDGQQVVYAREFGEAPERAVYRVGSVSKLYTDIAVMQLVEQGKLDLDAPVVDYLPDFDKAVTLRQLMAHRAGLVREPPVGSYFDADPPPIGEVVASLRATEFAVPPGSKTKYSNAALMTVGHIVESVAGRPFAEHLREAVFAPLGMADSSFEREARFEPRIPRALMWSYDGREFPAPTFDVLASAGNLYSTMPDQAELLKAIFRGGEPILQSETLQAMFEPQFGADSSFGLGFALARLDGRRRVGHGGAVYGFSTSLAALPDERLGVVASASLDVANSVVDSIATQALRALLARREGGEEPAFETPAAVDEATRARLAGRYTNDEGAIRLLDRDGELLLEATPYYRRRVRQLGEGFVFDDRLTVGGEIAIADGEVRLADKVYRRAEDPPPAEPPAAMREAVGEYGWNHNVLFLLEREGRLHALIEWVFLYPLTETGRDRWAFPNYGLYHDEGIELRRDRDGRIFAAAAAGVEFPRREPGAKDGKTFRIVPQRPVEELRVEAERARPPAQPAGLLPPDLVDLSELDPTLRFDIRYAATNNFLGARFYDRPGAYLQRPAAEALLRAHRALAAHGYGLLIHDAYRPWRVTKMFWDATPDAMKAFVANPERGSVHNRGAAVDLTLYDLTSGRPVVMPSGYDEFSERAYPDYAGGTSAERWRRDLLRRAMEAEGFRVYRYEWWHFDWREAARYPLLNLSFDELAGAR